MKEPRIASEGRTQHGLLGLDRGLRSTGCSSRFNFNWRILNICDEDNDDGDVLLLSVISRAPASDVGDSLSRCTSLSQTPYHRLHYSSAPRVNVSEMSLPTSPGLSSWLQSSLLTYFEKMCELYSRHQWQILLLLSLLPCDIIMSCY